MSEKEEKLINGWSIEQGDYNSPDYPDQRSYEDLKKEEKRKKIILYSVFGIIAVTILILLLNLIAQVG